MNSLKPVHDFFATRGPGSWIQGDASMDSQGATCRPTDTRATRFCLAAAILALEQGVSRLRPQWNELRARTNYGIAEWNDTPGRTFAEVLELLAREDA